MRTFMHSIHESMHSWRTGFGKTQVPKGGDKYMIRFPGVKGQILPKYLSAKTDNSVDFVVKEEGEKMGAETWHFEPEGTKATTRPPASVHRGFEDACIYART